MASFAFKTIFLVAIISCVFTQDLIASTAPDAPILTAGPAGPTVSKTFPNPDPSWTEYQVKACCPRGFNEVLNYCVRCKAPNVYDSVDQACKPCPQDHLYSNITQRCEYLKCNAPRAINPANNQCECKTVNGTIMTYKDDTNECVCPSNLPLWNGKYCVACPSQTEYDPKEKQCYHCPEGFIRDYNTHACVPGL